MVPSVYPDGGKRRWSDSWRWVGAEPRYGTMARASGAHDRRQILARSGATPSDVTNGACVALEVDRPEARSRLADRRGQRTAPRP